MRIANGKTAIITGGNSGIGFACAKWLASLDWKIVLAVRNLQRGEMAKNQIESEFPNARIEVMKLDLSSKKSIEDFVKGIIENKLDVDVFYANAGIYRVPFATAFDELESQMAVNCVANYFLYEGLKEYLHSLHHQVKFVLTSSLMARLDKFEETDIYGKKNYKPIRAYSKSKIALNSLYLYMCEKEGGTNLLPLLVHPGSTYTPLIAKAYPGKRFRIAAERFMRIFFHKPEKAALSTMYLLKDNVNAPTFAAPRGIFHVSGYPKEIRLYKGNLGWSFEDWIIKKTSKN